MQILKILFAFTCLSLPAAAAAQPLPAKMVEALPAVDRLFADFLAEAHVPGVVYGIVADGRLVHVRGLGVQDVEARRPVTADSLFRIASMSKAFTALAILKLRDDGKLSLDAPAEAYVPELRGWRYPTADSPRIRVRDLLSHAAGFVTDDPWGDRQQVLAETDFTTMLTAGVPFTRAPGTAFEYSNFGYALLGRIITNVSGKPYDRYISDTILRPLGMASTGYEVRDWPIERRAIGYRWEQDAWREEPTMRHGTFGAMGGVQTSANDYARWVAFLLSAWPPRDETDRGPVRRASVRELAQGLGFAHTASRPAASGRPPCRYASSYGKGMIAEQDCDLGFVLTHSGGYPGYGSDLLLLPDQGIGIFGFANRTYAGPPVSEAALAMHRAGLPGPRPISVSAALSRAYDAAGAMYRAGSLATGRGMLAANFLMDRSEPMWGREFARLKGKVGACATDAPVAPAGNLSGRFSWKCERGGIQGQLLLAPTNPPSIQALRLLAVEAASP